MCTKLSVIVGFNVPNDLSEPILRWKPKSSKSMKINQLNKKKVNIYKSGLIFLYSEGVCPVIFLKVVLKEVLELNPDS